MVAWHIKYFFVLQGIKNDTDFAKITSAFEELLQLKSAPYLLSIEAVICRKLRKEGILSENLMIA